MSTVVVVKKGGRAVIAADTLTKSGSTKLAGGYYQRSDKVFHIGDTYVGLVGAAAHGNVLESIIRRHPRALSFGGMSEVFETYLRLHTILKEEFHLNPREGDSDPYESSQIDALLVNPHGVFGIYTWREVFEYEKFWAIGSGREFALGAMHATFDRLETAEEIAEAGMAAGCEFDDGSGLPFTSYSVALRGPVRAGVKRRRTPSRG